MARRGRRRATCSPEQAVGPSRTNVATIDNSPGVTADPTRPIRRGAGIMRCLHANGMATQSARSPHAISTQSARSPHAGLNPCWPRRRSC